VSWLIEHDPLTRLLNRHAFMDRLEQALSQPPDGRSSRVLLYLDLDRFKDLNDAEGHRAGDQVLRAIGALVGEELRSTDALARLGGDAFAGLLADCSLLDACALAENVRSVIERYEYPGQHGIQRVEASIGLLELRADHLSPEDALHEVETACYAAKRAGRNRVWVCSDTASVDGE
jgi:diguanylate cyclase (GGDEF)-like protein